MTDVANVVLFERLSGIILCGHSYAGMVITGVADRLPELIASLVYIDAFVPQEGDSWWDLAGDRYRQLALDRSKADGFGVAPPQHLDPRCTPHPLAAFRQAIRLTGRWREVTSLPTRHDIIRDAPQDLVSIVLGLKGITATTQ